MQTSGNLQHHSVVQGEPDPATVALDILDAATDHSETRLPDIACRHHGRASPHTDTALARRLLGNLLAAAEAYIGGDCHAVA
ncbi:hypothetical protein D3C76_1269730 [compost metagenome]